MPSLDVACGYAPDPRCDTLMDANPAIPGLDHCGDARGPLPWPDGTFDLLVARDCLEHLSWRDTDAALAEWARVLRPGGSLYVQVPDAARVLAWWATGAHDELVNRLPADLVTGDLKRDAWTGVQWRLLGGHADGVAVREGDDYRLNAHFSLWTEPMLTGALERAGFVVTSFVVNVHPNAMVEAVKRDGTNPSGPAPA